MTVHPAQGSPLRVGAAGDLGLTLDVQMHVLGRQVEVAIAPGKCTRRALRPHGAN